MNAFRGREQPTPFAVQRDEARATRIRNGSKWKRVSRTYRTYRPLCERCGLMAEHVHHRVDLALGGEAYAWSNLEALCKRCHQDEHARRGGNADRGVRH